MNKLNKNIESKAAIFALGGVDIGNATAWLEVTGITRTKVTGTHKSNDKEGRLQAHYAKNVPRIAFAAVVMILLSPFLIIVSFFIFASSIRAVLINKEQAGFRDCRINMQKFISKVHNKAEIKDKSGVPSENPNPETKKVGEVLPLTDGDEYLKLFNVTLSDKYLNKSSLTLPAYTEIYERRQLEKFLVNPVRIDAWQILPAGNVLNRDNWIEMEIQYSDSRLPNKNAVLFLNFFQIVLLTRG